MCILDCSNGTFDGVEECDDNNTTDGDGCDSSCTIESGYICTGYGASTCNTVCGDGKKAGIEVCDDGNPIDGDGCKGDCSTVETGYNCIGGTPNSPDTCTTICGDGLRISTEECDDENTDTGDGCSDDCTVEDNWECDGGSDTSKDECVQLGDPQTAMISSISDDNEITVVFS